MTRTDVCVCGATKAEHPRPAAVGCKYFRPTVILTEADAMDAMAAWQASAEYKAIKAKLDALDEEYEELKRTGRTSE